MKILIIEDDQKIINFLKKGLEEESYTIDYALNGDEGYYLACVNEYDLILLDIMLPVKNGIEVCQSLRANNIQVPIIMLTAKDAIEDRIKGLDIGANDYLPKPFSFAELLARIRVQLRSSQNNLTQLKVDDLVLDLLSKTAKRGEDRIMLTSKEFSILELLMRNENKVLSESVISDSMSDLDNDNISNVVNVYIYRLRNKVDKPYSKKLIKTIRGLGFIINDE